MRSSATWTAPPREGLPDQITIRHLGLSLEVSVSWAKTWTLLLVLATWGAFVLYLAWPGREAILGSGLLGFLWPVAVLAWSAYRGLGDCFNTTVVTASTDRLTIRTRPFPIEWDLNRPAADIARLEVVETFHKALPRKRWTEFHVHVRTPDDDTIPVIKGLGTRDQATYLIGLISDHLGIEAASRGDGQASGPAEPIGDEFDEYIRGSEVDPELYPQTSSINPLKRTSDVRRS